MISLTPHQQKALLFDKHTSVTANAGSGKTFVLSKRYLEIALNTDISLRNIAAITFTDKAAGELYKKIADQIEEKLSDSTNEKLIRKLENLRRQLVSANISTIHSFCIDILKEHPVEAGIDANFIPIDEKLSNELIELSVEEVIKKSLQKKHEEERLKYLIRIFASKKIFADELKSLIKNRRNVLSLYEKIYKEPENEIAEFFYSKFIELGKESITAKKSDILSAVNKINDYVLSEKPGNKTALSASEILRKFSDQNIFEFEIDLFHKLRELICTNKCYVRKSGYLSTSYQDFERENILIKSFFDELCYFNIPSNHSEIELELAHFGKEIIYFFNKTLILYTEKKKESSFLDFEDILLITYELLKDEDIRKDLSEKYKYIMIDEYQDTNEIQYEIFLPILDYLKKGNLFVVGDEKQSIYMFRDAELEVFFKTKKEIEESSGRENILSLPDSFRMAPNLCFFTNYLFKNLFNKPVPVFNEVEHSALICAREDSTHGTIELLLAQNNNEVSDEADLVAKRILNLAEENIKWNDIAVLCRKRKSFTGLEKSFVKYKIPFSIIGGKGFYQKQVVYDIYNYFSFLLDSSNDSALVGILRSPFFTLSDAEIYEISLENGNDYWERFLNYTLKNKKHENVVKILSENLDLVNAFEVPVLLRKILNETDFLSVLSAKTNGEQELANIEKLLKQTINFNEHGFNTLFDYLDFLKESINRIEDEAQAAVSDDSDSVKIMTLHQAKGLEFQAVFLFKCDESSKSSKIRAKHISVDKNLGILTKLPVCENYFSEYETAPVVGAADYISDRKNIAELKRLLYVGITRAKDFLFISAEEKDKYPDDSFMALLTAVMDVKEENEIKISGNLKYLKIQDNSYLNLDDYLELKIPVVRKINKYKIFENETEQEEENKKILINKIKDRTKNEIISATKVAVYKQCPVKYQLTYEYGFTPILRQYKDWFQFRLPEVVNYEFNSREEGIEDKSAEDESNIKISAEIKGKIIHKILQNEIPVEEIEDYTELQLKNELNFLEPKNLQLIRKDIYKDISLFYNSSAYSELAGKKNYKNEFEIYIKENDYFLYGILDKIIFEQDKIIIVDYKTDNISEKEIPGRSQAYLNQLKFYSYIVNKLYKDFENFELRLIFVKHPENIIIKNVNKSDFELFKKEIQKMVEEIRNKKFLKNLNHCKECFFYINNNCIKND